MLWIHGWMGSGAEGEILQPLLGPGIRLVCPDLPGHGATPLGDWRLGDTVDALAELGRGCAAGMGYSMGGRLLMMAAARHPDVFPRLVVESAFPGEPEPEARAARRDRDAARAAALRRDGLVAFCEEWYRMDMWGGLTPPERTGDPEELAGALERFSSGGQPELHGWLRNSWNPLLWLAGSRDPAYGAHAEWVQAHTRCVVRVLDAGHNVHAQCPDVWARAVRDFLNVNPPRQDQVQ